MNLLAHPEVKVCIIFACPCDIARPAQGRPRGWWPRGPASTWWPVQRGIESSPRVASGLCCLQGPTQGLPSPPSPGRPPGAGRSVRTLSGAGRITTSWGRDAGRGDESAPAWQGELGKGVLWEISCSEAPMSPEAWRKPGAGPGQEAPLERDLET